MPLCEADILKKIGVDGWLLCDKDRNIVAFTQQGSQGMQLVTPDQTIIEWCVNLDLDGMLEAASRDGREYVVYPPEAVKRRYFE